MATSHDEGSASHWYAPRTPAEAVEAVVEGNRRFMQSRTLGGNRTLTRRQELGVEGQKPFAVIVTCSDSRCSPEVLFDCGLGDIFVIRVAGHVLDSLAIASIEYAVEHLGSLAVVVVGHEKCGAIAAAVGEFNARADGVHSAEAAAAESHHADAGDPTASHISSLLSLLFPCVQASVDAFAAAGVRRTDIDPAELVEAALRINVALTAKAITDKSPMLKRRVHDGRLTIAGFRYDIDSPPDENGDALDVIPLPPIVPPMSAGAAAVWYEVYGKAIEHAKETMREPHAAGSHASPAHSAHTPHAAAAHAAAPAPRASPPSLPKPAEAPVAARAAVPPPASRGTTADVFARMGAGPDGFVAAEGSGGHGVSWLVRPGAHGAAPKAK